MTSQAIIGHLEVQMEEETNCFVFAILVDLIRLLSKRIEIETDLLVQSLNILALGELVGQRQLVCHSFHSSSMAIY
jgi:hypothetical protein